MLYDLDVWEGYPLTFDPLEVPARDPSCASKVPPKVPHEVSFERAPWVRIMNFSSTSLGASYVPLTAHKVTYFEWWTLKIPSPLYLRKFLIISNLKNFCKFSILTMVYDFDSRVGGGGVHPYRPPPPPTILRYPLGTPSCTPKVPHSVYHERSF